MEQWNRYLHTVLVAHRTPARTMKQDDSKKCYIEGLRKAEKLFSNSALYGKSRVCSIFYMLAESPDMVSPTCQ